MCPYVRFEPLSRLHGLGTLAHRWSRMGMGRILVLIKLFDPESPLLLCNGEGIRRTRSVKSPNSFKAPLSFVERLVETRSTLDLPFAISFFFGTRIAFPLGSTTATRNPRSVVTRTASKATTN